MEAAMQIRSEETEGVGEFLTFVLGNEEYAVDILKVQEIRGYEAPTRLANAPAFIKGVLNLRGTIVPIIDLRIKLSMPKVEYTAVTVTMILNVAGVTVGLVVDQVSDVVALSAKEIMMPPDFSASFDTRYITGLANVDKRMLIVIDIDCLFNSGEFGLIAQQLDTPAA